MELQLRGEGSRACGETLTSGADAGGSLRGGSGTLYHIAAMQACAVWNIRAEGEVVVGAGVVSAKGSLS